VERLKTREEEEETSFKATEHLRFGGGGSREYTECGTDEFGASK